MTLWPDQNIKPYEGNKKRRKTYNITFLVNLKEDEGEKVRKVDKNRLNLE